MLYRDMRKYAIDGPHTIFKSNLKHICLTSGTTHTYSHGNLWFIEKKKKKINYGTNYTFHDELCDCLQSIF